jgi:hypothetical protein
MDCLNPRKKLYPFLLRNKTRSPNSELKIYSKKNSYPGGKCESASDCIVGGTCDASVCSGKKATEACTKVSQCVIGTTCVFNMTSVVVPRPGVCTAQVDSGKACVYENDCLNHLGCLKKVCTPYFSVNDTINVANDANVTNLFSFCLNGQMDSNMTCVTRNNALASDAACDSTKGCDYTSAEGTKTTDMNACKCGRNKLGNSYCTLGNGNFLKYFFALIFVTLS